MSSTSQTPEWPCCGGEPPPVSCALNAGTERIIEGYEPTPICYQNCAVKLSGIAHIKLGNDWTTFVETTGATCSSSPPVGNVSTPDGDNDLDNCIVSADSSYCYRDGETNCGTVNGDYVCLDAAPGACETGSAGGAICEETAASPPAPDNGTTAGVVASPEATQADACVGAPVHMRDARSESWIGPIEVAMMSSCSWTSPKRDEPARLTTLASRAAIGA